MRDSESTSSATRFVHANTSWYTCAAIQQAQAPVTSAACGMTTLLTQSFVQRFQGKALLAHLLASTCKVSIHKCDAPQYEHAAKCGNRQLPAHRRQIHKATYCLQHDMENSIESTLPAKHEVKTGAVLWMSIRRSSHHTLAEVNTATVALEATTRTHLQCVANGHIDICCDALRDCVAISLQPAGERCDLGRVKESSLTHHKICEQSLSANRCERGSNL
eukprot:355021-Chlamydomonas_euryale.AAC.11